MKTKFEDLPLTPKQQRFCDEYFIDFNATAAALRAGYSEATALNGSLMRIPKIIANVKRRSKNFNRKFKVNHDTIMEELAKIAFANMGDFFDAQGRPKPMHKLDKDTKAALWSLKVTDEGTVLQFRLSSKLGALEKLARHTGFYDGHHYPEQEFIYLDNKTLEEQDRFEDPDVAAPGAEVGWQMAEDGSLVAEDGGQISEDGSCGGLPAGGDIPIVIGTPAEESEVLSSESEVGSRELEVSGRLEELAALEEKLYMRAYKLDLREAELVKRENQDGLLSREPEGLGAEAGVAEVAVAVKPVYGNRAGQLTKEGLLIRDSIPNRAEHPHLPPELGLYVEKKIGHMVVKSFLTRDGEVG